MSPSSRPSFPSQLRGIDVQSSAYGYVVPELFGTMKIPGNVLLLPPECAGTMAGWNFSDMSQHPFAAVSIAIGLCEGPLPLTTSTVSWVWRDRLFYEGLAQLQHASGLFTLSGVDFQGAFFLLPGDNPQTPYGWTLKPSGAAASQFKEVGFSGAAVIVNDRLLLDPATLQGVDLHDANAVALALWRSKLPDFQFVTSGRCTPGGVTGPGVDADPAAVVSYIFGRCGADSTRLYGLAAVTTYAAATGFHISAYMNAQRPAADWIREVLETVNCDAFPHGLGMKVAPYYEDAPVIACDLGPDDTIPTDGLAYVKRKVTAQVDTFNSCPVEFTDAALTSDGYTLEEWDPTVTYGPDVRRMHDGLVYQSWIDPEGGIFEPGYGVNLDKEPGTDAGQLYWFPVSAGTAGTSISLSAYDPRTVSWSDFTDEQATQSQRKAPAVSARMLTKETAALLLSRIKTERSLYSRCAYSAQVKWQKALFLEPMDLVTFTDPHQSPPLDHAPARILSIEEGEDGKTFAIEAIEWPWGFTRPYPESDSSSA